MVVKNTDTRHARPGSIDADVNEEYDQIVEVALTGGALSDYAKLPRAIQPRIDNIIRRLGAWPNVSGVKPLVGNLSGNFRVRTGDYRIVFRVAAEKVVVWKIGNRKDIYID